MKGPKISRNGTALANPIEGISLEGMQWLAAYHHRI